MKRLMSLGAVVLGFMLLHGCGGAELQDQKRELAKAREAAESSETQFREAKERLEAERNEKIRVEEQVRLLNRRVMELQEAEKEHAEKLEAVRSEARKQTEERSAQAAPSSGREDGKSRVELLGAKAMAEYKAARLSEDLDKVKAELADKTTELTRLTDEMAGKENQAAALNKALEEAKAAEARTQASLTARVEELNKQVETITADSRESKRAADEKSGLLESFKSALEDARQLKARAEAETATVKARLAEVSQGLAQSLANMSACAGESDALRREIDNRMQELTKAQAEAEAARQEIVAQQVQGERARVELLALQADLELARRDKDAFHQEAAKLMVELDTRSKEASELRQRVGELTARVDTLEKSLAAYADNRPSSVDQILSQPATATEQPMAGPAPLY